MNFEAQSSSSVGSDGANGEDSNSSNFKVDVQVFDVAWIGLLKDVLELIGGPPVGGVIRGAADKVALLEVKVFFLADAAELRVLRVKVFVADSQGFLMPAADNQHAFRSSALEHLSQALFSNAFRQDTKGVHAHAAQSEGAILPELVVVVVSFLCNDVIEL